MILETQNFKYLSSRMMTLCFQLRKVPSHHHWSTISDLGLLDIILTRTNNCHGYHCLCGLEFVEVLQKILLKIQSSAFNLVLT